MMFKNPVIPGFYPDPSICRVGEDYYLVTSSFEYFPGVPVFHSKDLVNWEQIGHCLTRESQLPLKGAGCSRGIYAPTIRYHEGTFYMTTTNVTLWKNFYVTAADPAGEWSEPVWVEQGGIDPSLFFDDDGKVYFTSNSGADGKSGLAQAEIDIATGKLLTPTRLIWEGTGGRYVEAPHLYKINGIYYLIAAEGGTEYGHMVTCARSRSPWGPFEPCPYNPILSHRDRGGHPIQGTGHGDLIQAHDGSWWMVFLAFRPSVEYFHHLGRETFLAPVTWTDDGWPIVNGNGTVELEMGAPKLPAYCAAGEPARDDFTGASLGFQWNFLRNPYPGSWSLEERKGWLCLKGSGITLDDVDSPSMICRRQRHFDCKASTLVDFRPAKDGEEAGLAVYYSNEHHYEIAVVYKDESRILIVRRRIGDLQAIVYSEVLDRDDPVELHIKADKMNYYFAWAYPGEPVKEIAKGGTQYVSTEAARCSFTGVYFGIYATGNGKPCSVPAYFDWFEYLAD